MGFTRLPTGCLAQKSLVVGHLQPEGDRGPGEASQPQSPRVSHACTHLLRVAVFTVAKGQKWLRCPSAGGWIEKMRCICTVECYSAIKGSPDRRYNMDEP